MITMGVSCYWRFKGDKAWKFGWPSRIDGSRLIRMGRWNGDVAGGTIVDELDVEVNG